MITSAAQPVYGWGHGTTANPHDSTVFDELIYGATEFDTDFTAVGVTDKLFMAELAAQATPSALKPVPNKVRQMGCKVYCDMTYDQGRFILWVFSMIIYPSISIFGLFGNIASMMILIRQGMTKSSNILLMALAVGDTTFLLGANSVLEPWNMFYKEKITYQQAKYFHLLNCFQSICLVVGNNMSSLLVVLVTLERMVAVYMPLKFSIIVRPNRTRLAVLAVLLIALLNASIETAGLELLYKPSQKAMRIVTSLFFRENKALYWYLRKCYDYICGFIPVVTVCIGSILIGVKVSIATAKRSKMLSSSYRDKTGTQKAPRTSRTTLTLLAICIMFTCTLGVGFCMDQLLPDQKTWLIFILKFRVTYTLYAINSSSNFMIYILMNKNFRDTFISILNPRKKSEVGRSKLIKTPTSLTMS